MRGFLFVLGTLAAGAALPAAAPEVPLLPLAIPGYALRVLDVQKKVIVQVAGSDVEASVPIFVYYPEPGRAKALELLREARDGLIRLEGKQEWSAEELNRVVRQLEAGLGVLEKEG
jgi:hypothetical protein